MRLTIGNQIACKPFPQAEKKQGGLAFAASARAGSALVGLEMISDAKFGLGGVEYNIAAGCKAFLDPEKADSVWGRQHYRTPDNVEFILVPATDVVYFEA